jgi:hypothetical protein
MLTIVVAGFVLMQGIYHAVGATGIFPKKQSIWEVTNLHLCYCTIIFLYRKKICQIIQVKLDR